MRSFITACCFFATLFIMNVVIISSSELKNKPHINILPIPNMRDQCRVASISQCKNYRYVMNITYSSPTFICYNSYFVIVNKCTNMYEYDIGKLFWCKVQFTRDSCIITLDISQENKHITGFQNMNDNYSNYNYHIRNDERETL